MYWQYFNENRWKFYNRTQTENQLDETDFRTWDLQTLFNEIHKHYQLSLENELMLQQAPINTYDALLVSEKDSRIYRPTLFDFLSHEALEFYKTNETHITKPAFKFEIDNPEFLRDAQTFSKLEIASKDTTSLQLNALKIYQKLIRFHLKDASPYALSDVNISRLKFINTHATFNDKETIFLQTLKTESNLVKAHEVSALYDFEIASILYNQSKQYEPKTNEVNRWKAKEALDICEITTNKFPKSKGAEKCTFLKQQIMQPNLQITSEDFLPIQQNSRLLISYKNIETIDFKVYKISIKALEKLKKLYKKKEQLAFIKNLNLTKTWESKLRNDNDYQNHSTEVTLPKLDNGTFLIVATTKNSNETFAFSSVQVTNLAFVEYETDDYKIFQIIDRNTGEPIKNARVELTINESQNNTQQTELCTTNVNGEIKIEKTKDRYRTITSKVTHGNDTAYFSRYYVFQSYEPQEKEVVYKAFLFTDRRIYRPGQTVFFKGIILKKANDKSEVIANHEMYATLYDANGQEINHATFITNAFGSVSGSFILPSSGLPGEYYIDFGSETEFIYSTDFSFSVEEYKRPKFETKFTPVTETFKVNDSVTIKGTALAYAGSNITDAKVVYRVHRKVQYPNWYFWYRPWFNNEPQEIALGETKTNNNGEFEITFKSIPDNSIDKTTLPVFNYEITADVTDLNGETRSATTLVNVGYHALTANMTIDNKIDKSKKDHKLTIETKNLNGEFVAASGVVKIYKLQAPKTVLRQRPWEAPDYQEYSEETFKNLFPHDAYNNEHDSNNWKKGALVFEKSFNTETSKTVDLGNIKKWQSGVYLITLESKDKFNQLVKDEIKTTLYSEDDTTIADNQLFSITTNQASYKAGETAILTFASAANNLFVTATIEKNKKIVKTEIIQLNNNKKTISIPVTTEDIGGFAVNYSFAAFNSFKSGTEVISVPYPKTDLEIETTTFRDKLQPGTNETWRFKIKGPQGEKVSAELLASMYDASLDQFTANSWDFNPIENPLYYSNIQSNANQSFGTQNFRVYFENNRTNYSSQKYDAFNWFGFTFFNQIIRIRGYSSVSKSLNGAIAGVAVEEQNEDGAILNEVVMVGAAPKLEKDAESKQEKPNFDKVQIRKNLQETAFFFPQLQTDNQGHVSFNFTTPEALTQWKLQLLAHTKALESATKTLTTVTQKELMVIPNAPRFLREGDQITISSKIANLTDKPLSGHAILMLTDAVSGKTIDQELENSENNKTFSVEAKGNTQVSWSIRIPAGVDAVQYKIIAKSNTFSDGEQNALPVLSNRMLITETLPMWVQSNESKTFTLNKLKNNTSKSLKNHKLTLEVTSNPAWYAIQALPYLMEYPYQCNEQTFSRYYANALASYIVNKNPRIQEVFNQWATQEALISNLEKNEDLKSILIQETPWLRDTQSETEQKKRIAMLFNLNKLKNELQASILKLENNQMDSGAWAWFQGGQVNRYITQHIVSGFGHLEKLGVSNPENSKMIEKAIHFLDSEFIKEYKNLTKYDEKADLSKDHLTHTQLHYLYMRSFFPNVKTSKEVETIIAYYQTQIQKYWSSRSLYAKGLMALISERMGDKIMSAKILKALKENSITSNELGMYWKENTNSWYWYQAPIETQALLIEAFSEIENDTETIDNLKIWLLTNKQTNQWKTTKATTEAAYALLLQGSDWLSVTDAIDVVVGGKQINPSKLENVKVEAGTGYFKTAWNTSEIKPDMSEVTLTKKGNGIAWGSLYWQYFEDLDKITSAETPLQLKKKLFLKTNTDMGQQISEITDKTELKVGDLVTVRIELRSDRTMEFVHMKDMRASGLEPVNVLSKYKWQDGLGYYEATKDASTNFFFDYLPKGVFVFEYDLRVNNAGNMSNGITTIQSMYAPEFSSHSEGIRIQAD